MKRNELKALLAVSVIAVPLVFSTGCGKKTEAPADTASTVAVTETMVAETIEDGLANMGIELETEVSVDETLDESELYTEDNNEDIIVEETEPAEQTDSDVTEDPELTANDGVNYDKETGVITVIVNGEVADRVTKEEVESWGMTVDQYLSLFSKPSGGSSKPADYKSAEEMESDDQTVWGSGDYTGADRGHIQ